MIAEKKTWKTLQLRVLVRCRSEEAVLAACKYGGRPGPGSSGGGCKKKNLGPCDMPANSWNILDPSSQAGNLNARAYRRQRCIVRAGTFLHRRQGREMEATRHQWDKPELTVLVRNRPEEAVLAACKYSGRTSPGSNRTGCRRHVTGNTCAGSQCDLIAPS